jgi:hypothetical protein
MEHIQNQWKKDFLKGIFNLTYVNIYAMQLIGNN